MLAYAGEGRVIAELVDLDELIRELLDLLQASVAQHCTLEYVSAGPLPRIRADPTQVRQVLLNVIVNASEAVEDNGRITISGGSETLTSAALNDMTLSADATPGRFAYLEIKDTGPGMDAATMARIFDPFFSTKQSARGLRAGGGAGDRAQPQRRAARLAALRATARRSRCGSRWSQRSWRTRASRQGQVSGIRYQVSRTRVAWTCRGRCAYCARWDGLGPRSDSRAIVSLKAIRPAAPDRRLCRRRFE